MNNKEKEINNDVRNTSQANVANHPTSSAIGKGGSFLGKGLNVASNFFPGSKHIKNLSNILNTKKGKSSPSDLQKKEGLESKEKDNKLSLPSKKNLLSKIFPPLFPKKAKNNKTLKKPSIKTTLILFGVLFSISIVFTALFFVYNSLTTGIKGIFGIKDEGDGGLWSTSEYIVDSNGNYLDLEDYETEDGQKVKGLFTILEENACQSSIFYDFLDANFSVNFNNDPCRLLNYIDKRSKKLERQYEGVSIDRNLVMSSIFYAYDFQHQEEDEEYISADQTYEVLKNILENGIIDRQDVNDIMESMILKKNFDYYYFNKKDNMCYKKTAKMYTVDFKKFDIFMKYGYSDNKYMNEYERIINNNSSYINSDDRCRHLTNVNNLYNPEKLVYTIPYEDLMNSNKVYTPYDYRYGFMYNKFAYYKKEKYDFFVTPKKIEYNLYEIKDKKDDYDSLFQIKEQTSKKRKSSNKPLTVERYCYNYNYNTLNDIKVVVRDCNNKEIDIILLKEYLIGVAVAETGFYKNIPNYNKAQLVAEMSYALGRNANYKHGNVLYMRSGDCDQNWCSPTRGCSRILRAPATLHSTYTGFEDNTVGKATCLGKKGYWRCAMSQDQINTYLSWIEETLNYVNATSETGYNGAYNSTVQLGWGAKARRNIPYPIIIKDTYPASKVYDCSKYEIENGFNENLYSEVSEYDEELY